MQIRAKLSFLCAALFLTFGCDKVTTNERSDPGAETTQKDGGDSKGNTTDSEAISVDKRNPKVAILRMLSDEQLKTLDWHPIFKNITNEELDKLTSEDLQRMKVTPEQLAEFKADRTRLIEASSGMALTDDCSVDPDKKSGSGATSAEAQANTGACTTPSCPDGCNFVSAHSSTDLTAPTDTVPHWTCIKQCYVYCSKAMGLFEMIVALSFMIFYFHRRKREM